jgi:hypothetical protein
MEMTLNGMKLRNESDDINSQKGQRHTNKDSIKRTNSIKGTNNKTMIELRWYENQTTGI